jgi:hypothetical protein
MPGRRGDHPDHRLLGVFYFGFVQRARGLRRPALFSGHGVYDGLRARLNQSTLDALTPQVELYRIGHGEYPKDLDQLAAGAPKASPIMIYDANVARAAGGLRELLSPGRVRPLLPAKRRA